MTGTRPVVDYMFFDFALDALGELINQTAKIKYMSDGRLRMPIVLRGCVGVGKSAATHHSGSYYALFAQVPGRSRPPWPTPRGSSRPRSAPTTRSSSWSTGGSSRPGARCRTASTSWPSARPP
jgi:hypothetical protein